MHFPRLVKAQAVSLTSTAVDFLVTIGCVEGLRVWYLAATVLGNTAGGLTSFYLGRHLVFRATQQAAHWQGIRYLVVWLGSLLLNAGGVYVFTQVLQANYLYSKIVVSLLVGIGFNYFLQLHFVFRKS